MINLWSLATNDGTTDDGPTDDGLTDDGAITEPPSLSQTQAPIGTGPSDCKSISRRRFCVNTQGFSWKRKNGERGCFDALTSDKCSRWDFVQSGPNRKKLRKRCRNNRCIRDNPQCNGRWD